MTLASFRKRWKGKRCGKGQCVDLFRAWVRATRGDAYKGIPRVVAAKDIWKAASTRHWRKVRWTGTNSPPLGAIIVYARGRWGHVDIARARCTAKRFNTFGQNWSRPKLCADEVFDVAQLKRMQCIGWLIAK